MRRIIVIALAAGCAQQTELASGGSVVGTTTVAHGTPTVRTDTTRPTSPPRETVPAPATGDVTLRLDHNAYTRGSPLMLTIRNQTRDTLGFNPCSSRKLERKEGFATWVGHAEPNRMCTMELRLLGPGERQDITTDIPSQVGAGTYRLVFTLMPQTPGARSITIISETFEVR